MIKEEQQARNRADLIGLKLSKRGETYKLIDRSTYTVVSFPEEQPLDDIVRNLALIKSCRKALIKSCKEGTAREQIMKFLDATGIVPVRVELQSPTNKTLFSDNLYGTLYRSNSSYGERPLRLRVI